MTKWIKTSEPGIYLDEKTPGKLRVHATALCPTTNKMIHRRKTLNQSTMAQAIEARELLKAEIREQQLPSSTVNSKSITYFAAHWAAEMIECGRWGFRSADTNEKILKLHILPIIGHVRVDEFTREHVRRWIDYAENATFVPQYPEDEKPPEPIAYSHGSLRRYWTILKALIKALYLEGFVDRRLVEWCAETRGPKAESRQTRREMRTLSATELRTFLTTARKVVPSRYPEIVTLALTGMRSGELFGLSWKNVDLVRGVIRVEASYSMGVLKGTKTGRTRTVPLLPEVIEALKEQHARLVEQKNLGLEDDIVFPTREGIRRGGPTLHKPLARVADRCKLVVKVGPQVLRKTFITQLRAQGASDSMIQSIVGHETDEMTDHYTEYQPDDQHAAIKALKNLI